MPRMKSSLILICLLVHKFPTESCNCFSPLHQCCPHFHFNPHFHPNFFSSGLISLEILPATYLSFHKSSFPSLSSPLSTPEIENNKIKLIFTLIIFTQIHTSIIFNLVDILILKNKSSCTFIRKFIQV